MVFTSIESIIQKAKDNPGVKRVAVAGAELDHVIEAVLRARKDGIAEPFLIGNKVSVKQLVENAGGSLPDEQYIDIASDDPMDICFKAIELVKENKADLIMKGSVNTREILKAVLDKERGLEHEQLITQFSFAKIPGCHKLVVLNDPAITPHPTLEQKARAIRMIAKTLRNMGYDETIRVAALCAAETVSIKIPESMDAAELTTMSNNGEFPGVCVFGPIQLDSALVPEIAKLKKSSNPVAGNADVLLFPDLAAGNLTSKMLTVFGGGISVGMVIGACVPISVTSRAATAEAKYESLAMASCAAMKRTAG